jgi:hypothetical protein
MMKQILAMTRKEILLWAQKPGSWVIVFVVPILFIWIIQAVFGSSGIPVVTVYAVNEDDSRRSRQVMRALRDATTCNMKSWKRAKKPTGAWARASGWRR